MTMVRKSQEHGASVNSADTGLSDPAQPRLRSNLIHMISLKDLQDLRESSYLLHLGTSVPWEEGRSPLVHFRSWYNSS